MSFDIFTFVDGASSNHQKETQTFGGANPSGRTMVDGPIEITE